MGSQGQWGQVFKFESAVLTHNGCYVMQKIKGLELIGFFVVVYFTLSDF